MKTQSKLLYKLAFFFSFFNSIEIILPGSSTMSKPRISFNVPQADSHKSDYTTLSKTFWHSCTHKWAFIHTNTPTHTYTHTQIHTHIYTNTYTYLYIHLHIHKPTYTHTHTPTHTYNNTYIHQHIHLIIHTHIHKHIHTY